MNKSKLHEELERERKKLIALVNNALVNGTPLKQNDVLEQS